MQMTVIEEKDNPFFKRKELTLLLKHEATSTPPKAELIKMVAAAQGVQESQVVVEYIFTKKGISESLAKVMVLSEAPKQPEAAAAPAQTTEVAQA